MRAADWLVDLGPGAGRHGGEPRRGRHARTGDGHGEVAHRQYLRGLRQIEVPKVRRPWVRHAHRGRRREGAQPQERDREFLLGTLT